MTGGSDVLTGALSRRQVNAIFNLFVSNNHARIMLTRNEQVDEHHGITRGQRHIFQEDVVGLQIIMEEFQPFG